MPPSLREVKGVRIFECSAEGPQLQSDRDAIGVMSEAWSHRATFIVIPVGRLGDGFFDLKTGVAGEIIQRFVMYGWRIAIIGNISREMSESESLRAFVSESNRGNQVWFLSGRDELYQWLANDRSGGAREHG
jgi:hypothetical protein